MSIISPKIGNSVRLAFSKPYDRSTAEGRSKERYRRAALTTLVMAGARVSNVLTGILLVPITLKYLGNDLFGVWMAITSFVGFLSFYDFGIGTGLRNLILKCEGKGDVDGPPKLIGNALIALFLLAGLMVVLVLLVAPLLPWSTFIKCSDPLSAKEILPTVQACLIMFAIGLPVTQLQNIANGFQRGYWGYLCIFIGRILGFLFVMLCVWLHWPLWLLASGYIGFPFLITIIGWLVFLIRCPALRPWPVIPDILIMKSLFGVGFFVLLHHLSVALVNTSGVLLIANTINAASSVPYSVTMRLLGVTTVLVAPMLMGLSAAAGEAWHAGDVLWLRKTVRRTEIMSVSTAVLPCLLMLGIGPFIVQLWTQNNEAIPNYTLLITCVFMSIFFTVGSIYSNFLIAMNYVRYVSIVKVISGVAVVTLGLYFGNLTQSPTSIAFIQMLIGASIPAFFCWLKLRRLLKSKIKLNETNLAIA